MAKRPAPDKEKEFWNDWKSGLTVQDLDRFIAKAQALPPAWLVGAACEIAFGSKKAGGLSSNRGKEHCANPSRPSQMGEVQAALHREDVAARLLGIVRAQGLEGWQQQDINDRLNAVGDLGRIIAKASDPNWINPGKLVRAALGTSIALDSAVTEKLRTNPNPVLRRFLIYELHDMVMAGPPLTLHECAWRPSPEVDVIAQMLGDDDDEVAETAAASLVLLRIANRVPDSVRPKPLAKRLASMHRWGNKNLNVANIPVSRLTPDFIRTADPRRLALTGLAAFQIDQPAAVRLVVATLQAGPTRPWSLEEFAMLLDAAADWPNPEVQEATAPYLAGRSVASDGGQGGLSVGIWLLPSPF